MADAETRALLVELLREFHRRDWVSGTGGGICGPSDDGNLLLELSERTEPILASPDWLPPMKTAS